jgi:hypothetical protein
MDNGLSSSIKISFQGILVKVNHIQENTKVILKKVNHIQKKISATSLQRFL